MCKERNTENNKKDLLLICRDFIKGWVLPVRTILLPGWFDQLWESVFLQTSSVLAVLPACEKKLPSR